MEGRDLPPDKELLEHIPVDMFDTAQHIASRGPFLVAKEVLPAEGGLAFKSIGQGPIGSFGKPGPGLEMKILDENENECPPGVPGEICSRPAPDAEGVYTAA